MSLKNPNIKLFSLKLKEKLLWIIVFYNFLAQIQNVAKIINVVDSK